MGIEYLTVKSAKEPILIAENINASFGEVVKIKLPTGEIRKGRIIGISKDKAIIEVFKGVSGINPKKVKLIPTGKTATMALSPLMIGRFFNGAYEPLDNKEKIMSDIHKDINGFVINPVVRDVPSEFIQTGISSIDGLNSLIRGQKLAIFTSSSINNYEFTLQLVKQSRILNKDENFMIIFCGLGIPHEQVDYFVREFKKKGVINKTCSFINTSSDPVIERITAPRYALTAAQYFAFDLGMHVLVILFDMNEYCNALREISSSKEELPMRRGYPSYMYSDLASIYERCGRIKNKKGSVTLLPILTMPNDDITHPVPDLTGYITEGQIILNPNMYKKGIYPPVDIMPSLSRLMHKGVGSKKTREDHRELADQIYASYAKAKRITETAAIIGLESISDRDRLFIKFRQEFDKQFINQGVTNRGIIETLNIGWKLLSLLDVKDLTVINQGFINKYLKNMGTTKNHYTNKKTINSN